jgi:hypothetical protein
MFDSDSGAGGKKIKQDFWEEFWEEGVRRDLSDKMI